jgi:hypothetical protein
MRLIALLPEKAARLAFTASFTVDEYIQMEQLTQYVLEQLTVKSSWGGLSSLAWI